MIEKINFNSMTGTLFIPDNFQKKYPFVIFFHGMTSSEKNYLPLANQLLENNIASLTVNIRGHGTDSQNFNKLSINDAIDDALNCYQFIKNRSEFNGILGACGASLGATLATSLATFPELKSLVLRSPAAYPIQNLTFQQIMAKESTFFQNTNDLGKAGIIKRFTGSLLVIKSEHDDIIPDSLSDLFLSTASFAKNKQVITIANATHDLSKQIWIDEFRNQTKIWFSNSLK